MGWEAGRLDAPSEEGHWMETCVVRLFVGETGGVELDLRGQVELVKDGRVERFSSAEEVVAILLGVSHSSGTSGQTPPG